MTDARAVVRATASEATFQAAVIALAERMGWICFHATGCEHYRRNAAGFPDLVLVKDGFMWFLELKKAGRHPTAAQDRWQQAIRACTQVTASWAQPGDWDAIADVLVSGPARAGQTEAGR